MKTTDKATCARCHGVNSDETRRHCAPCILRALLRWPSLKIYPDRARDEMWVAKDGSTS